MQDKSHVCAKDILDLFAVYDKILNRTIKAICDPTRSHGRLSLTCPSHSRCISQVTRRRKILITVSAFNRLTHSHGRHALAERSSRRECADENFVVFLVPVIADTLRHPGSLSGPHYCGLLHVAIQGSLGV